MFEEIDRNALLVELHRCVEETARSVASHVRRNDTSLQYPPNNGMTAEELKALSCIQWSDAFESALRKIIADAAAYPLFHLFCLLDGVCDVPPIEKPASEVHDESGQMLHDAFLDAYWEWRRHRPDPGWKLDMYDGP